MLCLSCGAQMSLTRCVRGRGSCAHPTPSRGPAVSHCDHHLPQESSLTPTLSRHFCPSTSVSVCEGPEAFLLPPHARLAFSHTVRPCCIFVPTQRLLGSPVQRLTAAPHHEPSGGGHHLSLKAISWLSNSSGVIMDVIHHCGAPAPQPASRNVSSV